MSHLKPGAVAEATVGLLSILEHTLISELSAKQPELYYVKTHSLISEALEVLLPSFLLSSCLPIVYICVHFFKTLEPMNRITTRTHNDMMEMI